MNIQETISVLQRQIKYQASLIRNWEETRKYWLNVAKEDVDSKYYWRNYHYSKDGLKQSVKEQAAYKSMYKLMCEIRNQMPYDSVIIITTNEIREM